MNNMTLKDRLIQIAESHGLTIAEFERTAGLSNGYMKNFKGSLGSNKMEYLLRAFPDINPTWLLMGEGEMSKKEGIDPETVRTDPTTGFNYIPPTAPAEGNGNEDDEEELKIYKRANGKMIPFYDAETTGGFEGAVSSSSGEARLVGYINAGDWFDGRETAAIRHVGDSMTEYPNGCILAVREVRNRGLLVPGKNYVIETDEYRVTKRVQRGSSRDTIALYSTNRETYADGRLIHEPFEVNLEDVRRIFTVLGYIVNQQGEAHLRRF